MSEDLDGVVFHFEIVGGPYDGAPGLMWFDDGAHATPDHIFLGRCPGDQSCGEPRCSRRRKHIAYWTREEEVPMATIKYAKQDEHVRRIEQDGCVLEFVGTTSYVMGGADFLKGRRVEQELPAGQVREMPAPAKRERVAAHG